MGGEANFCIQYSDGTRDSYQPYNKGMGIIPNTFEFLQCRDPKGRDEIAKKVLKEQVEIYEGSDSGGQTNIGLSPHGYGLVFVDVENKFILDAQGQNDIWMHHHIHDYANGFVENFLKLADNGLVIYTNDITWYDDNAKWSKLDVEIAKSFVNERTGCFRIEPELYGWSLKSFNHCDDDQFDFIRSKYDLSLEEEDRWLQFLTELRE